MTTTSAERVADLFRLTEEESFVLVATKWWLMAQDRDLDPDAPDREAKAPVVLQYGLEVHRACQRELECFDDDLPPVEREALLERVRRPGWPPAVRRALGDAPFETVESLFADWPFIAALLKTITRRERAVLLTVELASYYPWPPDVLYEKDVRDEQLGAIVDALGAPIDRELLHELLLPVVSGAAPALRAGAVGSHPTGLCLRGLDAARRPARRESGPADLQE